MARFVLILIIAVCFSSCEKFNSAYCQTPESRKRENLANRVIVKAATKIKKEKGISPIGTGGRTSDGIQMLALSFMCYRPLTINEARALVVEIAQEFLKVINSEEEIHRYLNPDPFETKNLEIRLFLFDSNGAAADPDKLSVVNLIKGFFKYKIDDLQTNGLKTIYQETYEEALERIQNLRKFSEAL